MIKIIGLWQWKRASEEFKVTYQNNHLQTLGKNKETGGLEGEQVLAEQSYELSSDPQHLCESQMRHTPIILALLGGVSQIWELAG